MLDYTLIKGDPDDLAGRAVLYAKDRESGLLYFRLLVLRPDTVQRETYDYVAEGLGPLCGLAPDVLFFGEVSPGHAKSLIEEADGDYMERYLHALSRARMYSDDCSGSLSRAQELYDSLRAQLAMSLVEGDYETASALSRDIKNFQKLFPFNEDGVRICDY